MNKLTVCPFAAVIAVEKGVLRILCLADGEFGCWVERVVWGYLLGRGAAREEAVRRVRRARVGRICMLMGNVGAVYGWIMWIKWIKYWFTD